MVASQDISAPSIVVIGATGSQGGSVINHLLKSGRPYRIRAVTRDSSKPNAEELASNGVEVVQANLGSKEELNRAFKDQQYVFANTLTSPTQLEEGKRLMDSIKDASPSVVRVLWSGVQSPSKISKGKLSKVDHFDVKLEILEYGRKAGLPIVDVQAGSYMDNHLTYMAPRKQEDGSFVFALPMAGSAILTLISTYVDYGAFVRGALEADVKAGEEVYAFSEELTVETMVQRWSEVTGQRIKFYSADPAQFAGQAGEPILQMFEFIEEYGYFAGKDLSLSRKLLPAGYSLQTWKEFVSQADWSKVFA